MPVTQATAELLSSSACVGADCLMKHLGNYCRNQDIKTAITVGVVGKSVVLHSVVELLSCALKYFATFFRRLPKRGKEQFDQQSETSTCV